MPLVLFYHLVQLLLERLVAKPVLANQHYRVIIWLVCRDDSDQVLELVLRKIFDPVHHIQKFIFVIFSTLLWIAPDSSTKYVSLRDEDFLL